MVNTMPWGKVISKAGNRFQLCVHLLKPSGELLPLFSSLLCGGDGWGNANFRRICGASELPDRKNLTEVSGWRWAACESGWRRKQEKEKKKDKRRRKSHWDASSEKQTDENWLIKNDTCQKQENVWTSEVSSLVFLEVKSRTWVKETVNTNVPTVWTMNDIKSRKSYKKYQLPKVQLWFWAVVVLLRSCCLVSMVTVSQTVLWSSSSVSPLQSVTSCVTRNAWRRWRPSVPAWLRLWSRWVLNGRTKDRNHRNNPPF